MFAYVSAFRAMAPKTHSSQSTEEIARRLTLLRQALGYSQAFLAGLLGCTPQAWGNYETGERRISISLALKLCGVTGISLDWIYRGNMNMLPVELAEKIQIEMRIEAAQARKVSRRS